RIEMVARVRNGTTKKLATLQKNGDTGDQELAAFIDGPYGTSSHASDLLNGGFNRVLVIAGGVGGTFALSWVSSLIKKMGREKVHFVWAVKTVEDVMWALKLEEEVEDSEIAAETASCVEVYVTGPRDELK